MLNNSEILQSHRLTLKAEAPDSAQEKVQFISLSPNNRHLITGNQGHIYHFDLACPARGWRELPRPFENIQALCARDDGGVWLVTETAVHAMGPEPHWWLGESFGTASISGRPQSLCGIRCGEGWLGLIESRPEGHRIHYVNPATRKVTHFTLEALQVLDLWLEAGEIRVLAHSKSSKALQLVSCQLDAEPHVVLDELPLLASMLLKGGIELPYTGYWDDFPGVAHAWHTPHGRIIQLFHYAVCVTGNKLRFSQAPCHAPLFDLTREGLIQKPEPWDEMAYATALSMPFPSPDTLPWSRMAVPQWLVSVRHGDKAYVVHSMGHAVFDLSKLPQVFDTDEDAALFDTEATLAGMLLHYTEGPFPSFSSLAEAISGLILNDSDRDIRLPFLSQHAERIQALFRQQTLRLIESCSQTEPSIDSELTQLCTSMIEACMEHPILDPAVQLALDDAELSVHLAPGLQASLEFAAALRWAHWDRPLPAWLYKRVTDPYGLIASFTDSEMKTLLQEDSTGRHALDRFAPQWAARVSDASVLALIAKMLLNKEKRDGPNAAPATRQALRGRLSRDDESDFQALLDFVCRLDPTETPSARGLNGQAMALLHRCRPDPSLAFRVMAAQALLDEPLNLSRRFLTAMVRSHRHYLLDWRVHLLAKLFLTDLDETSRNSMEPDHLDEECGHDPASEPENPRQVLEKLWQQGWHKGLPDESRWAWCAALQAVALTHLPMTKSTDARARDGLSDAGRILASIKEEQTGDLDDHLHQAVRDLPRSHPIDDLIYRKLLCLRADGKTLQMDSPNWNASDEAQLRKFACTGDVEHCPVQSATKKDVQTC